MRQIFVLVLVFMISSGLMAQKGKSKPTKNSKTVKAPAIVDSFSYAVGISIASNMQQQGITQINYAALQKGMDAIFKNQTKLLDENQINMTIQQKLQEFMMKKVAAQKAQAQAFFEANAKRKGIVSLPNGLQYEVIQASTDSNFHKPSLKDTVIVNYVGSLLDGLEFENSYSNGQPAVFRVAGVITGWSMILQMMRVGDKWRVYIPTELAYNMNPPTPLIPPGASLIFDISLEGIKPAITTSPVQTPNE